MLGQDFFVFIWVPVVMIVAIVQMRKNASFGHTFGMLVLATYVCVLIIMTFFPFPVQPSWIADLRNGDLVFSKNFHPFKTISDILTHGFAKVSISQLIGNFLLLVPLTFLLPSLWERFRSFKSAFLFAAAISLGIELLQLALSAAFGFAYKTTDIADFLLNVTGATIGYGIYAIITHIARA